MESNIFRFNVDWNYRTISLFLVLLAIPNILGMANLSTPFGFKIHFFQFAIFLAAAIYGPTGGMLAGLTGSLYSAAVMSNPYIAVGNAILGAFTGLFMRYKFNTIVAVALAFLIQLPWLIGTDYFLIGMPLKAIWMLVVALAVSNTVWAALAQITLPRLKDAAHA
jgi:hypothetical protein